MHFLASLYSEIPPERFANGIGYNWKNIKVFCADRISVLVGVWFSAYKRIEGVDMKLYLKNIGKVEEAFIELNGITVIAGENNTEKHCGAELCLLFSTLLVILRSRFNRSD